MQHGTKYRAWQPQVSYILANHDGQSGPRLRLPRLGNSLYWSLLNLGVACATDGGSGRTSPIVCIRLACLQRSRGEVDDSLRSHSAECPHSRQGGFAKREIFLEPHNSRHSPIWTSKSWRALKNVFLGMRSIPSLGELDLTKDP